MYDHFEMFGNVWFCSHGDGIVVWMEWTTLQHFWQIYTFSGSFSTMSYIFGGFGLPNFPAILWYTMYILMVTLMTTCFFVR